MRIEAARLVIRSFEPRDAEPWIALFNDPEVTRFALLGPPATLETFERTLQRRREMERERGYAVWAVEDSQTGVFIGQCGLSGKRPEIYLAYHYTPASWNKGYGTEAAAAVLAHGLGAGGLERIVALVIPENVGSCRVAEKVGMRYVGTATYHDMPGLKKYVAERAWWSAPPCADN